MNVDLEMELKKTLCLFLRLRAFSAKRVQKCVFLTVVVFAIEQKRREANVVAQRDIHEAPYDCIVLDMIVILCSIQRVYALELKNCRKNRRSTRNSIYIQRKSSMYLELPVGYVCAMWLWLYVLRAWFV